MKIDNAVKVIPRHPIAVLSAVVVGSNSATPNKTAPRIMKIQVSTTAICLLSFESLPIIERRVMGRRYTGGVK